MISALGKINNNHDFVIIEQPHFKAKVITHKAFQTGQHCDDSKRCIHYKFIADITEVTRELNIKHEGRRHIRSLSSSALSSLLQNTHRRDADLLQEPLIASSALTDWWSQISWSTHSSPSDHIPSSITFGLRLLNMRPPVRRRTNAFPNTKRIIILRHKHSSNIFFF